MEKLKKILEYRFFEMGDFSLSVYTLFTVILIFLIAKVIIFLLTMLIRRGIKHRGWVGKAKEYTIVQLSKYIIYTISFIIAIDTLGVNISILIASSAALFVGIGLGLQKTFNDFISGIILLFESTIAVGDVIEVGTFIGVVKEINLRTSTILTRDSITMIIPNSMLVTGSVINWSHGNKNTRFHVRVGVAYGSDTEKVEKVLTKIAADHPDVFATPPSEVRMYDFGDSALLFDLLFWTDQSWEAERIKSQLRFNIDKAFRENNILIPFPQRDVHMKG